MGASALSDPHEFNGGQPYSAPRQPQSTQNRACGRGNEALRFWPRGGVIWRRARAIWCAGISAARRHFVREFAESAAPRGLERHPPLRRSTTLLDRHRPNAGRRAISARRSVLARDQHRYRARRASRTTPKTCSPCAARTTVRCVTASSSSSGHRRAAELSALRRQQPWRALRFGHAGRACQRSLRGFRERECAQCWPSWARKAMARCRCQRSCCATLCSS